MKKILLGTTAVIALGTMTTQAFAAEKIKLGLGGFMRQYVSVVNNDEVASTSSGAARDKSFGQGTNTEVYFSGSTVLDNGIKVAAKIEMEADGDVNKNVDRSYLTISSDAMGSLTVGNAPHFGDGNLVRVPNAGNFDWGDTDSYASTAVSATASSTGFATVAPDISAAGGDSVKLSYASPSFSGVTVGFSYAAEEDGDLSNAKTVAGSAEDGATVGIAYSGELGGAAVSADLTRMRFGGDNADITHVGLNVGMAGFTVGGGYSDFNDTAAGSSARDGEAWELGVAYETGPYTVSAAYMVAKEKATTATAGDDKDTKWNIAATYSLGGGVALSANYFNSKADPEGNGTTIATGKSTQVSGLIAGIEVGF